MSQIEIDNALDACFGCHIGRDCYNCPAHPDNGGSCCFGDPDKYDPDDRECKATCPHRQDCTTFIEENYEFVEEEEAPVAPRRPPIRPVSRGARVITGSPVTRTPSPPPSNEPSTGRWTSPGRGRDQFVSDVVRGSLLGFFGSGRDFFQRYRLNIKWPW